MRTDLVLNALAWRWAIAFLIAICCIIQTGAARRQ